MMLLGMGADGHVGSLYPHKPTLEPTMSWVIPFQVRFGCRCDYVTCVGGGPYCICAATHGCMNAC
jgi:6-phosphogluconolactonase/glucosamine-6-phosphate isomerase/deaminase